MLVCENLYKTYGNKQALKNVSLTVEPGEIVALLGRNGAGKTTLMNCIAGIVHPNSGSIYYNDQLLLPESWARSNFGILISAVFFDYLNVERNLSLLIEASGRTPRNDIKEKITKILSMVGLIDQRNKKVKTFSFGMKQRLGLAQALVEDAEFLMLDEPLVGLDPIGRALFKDIFAREARENNKAILFSSHELSDVADICDRVIMIEQGSIVYTGVYQDERTVVIHTSFPVHQISSWPDVSISGCDITMTNPARLNELITDSFFLDNPIVDVSVHNDSLTRLFQEHDHD